MFFSASIVSLRCPLILENYLCAVFGSLARILAQMLRAEVAERGFVWGLLALGQGVWCRPEAWDVGNNVKTIVSTHCFLYSKGCRCTATCYRLALRAVSRLRDVLASSTSCGRSYFSQRTSRSRSPQVRAGSASPATAVPCFSFVRRFGYEVRVVTSYSVVHLIIYK